MIFVSGTAAWGPEGRLAGEGDFFKQTELCLRNIAAILEKAGASLGDVVRTRIYTTDMSRWEDVARAHSAAFAADNRPASTLVEVSRLADPQMLVEIEADAVVR